jgi:TRAP-type C4-dicarboxylate transport system substrate-binding protein
MDRIVVKFGGYQGAASINTRGAARFGEVLQRALGERVQFELVRDVLALGRQSGELPGMVERGELTMCYMSTVRFTTPVPDLKLLELPFIVPDRPTAIRALDGALGGRFTQRMHERTPFRVLGFWDNGFRHITNKVRPIHTPADCKGLRIRTQISELHGEALAALGFEPIPVDIKEFVYASWPPDVRQAVDAAAREATTFQRELAAHEDDDILAKVDPRENEVIALSAAEHDAFVKAVEPVVERHRKSLDPALFDYLR